MQYIATDIRCIYTESLANTPAHYGVVISTFCWNLLMLTSSVTLTIAMFFYSSKTRKTSGRKIRKNDIMMMLRFSLIICLSSIQLLVIYVSSIHPLFWFHTHKHMMRSWITISVIHLNAFFNPLLYTLCSSNFINLLQNLKQKTVCTRPHTAKPPNASK